MCQCSRRRWLIGVLLVFLAISLFFGILALRANTVTQVTIEDLLANQTAHENKFIEVYGLLRTSFGLDECSYGNGVLASEKFVGTGHPSMWLHNTSGYSLPQVNERPAIIQGWFRQEITPCKTPLWFIEVTRVDLIETFEIPSTVPQMP